MTKQAVNYFFFVTQRRLVKDQKKSFQALSVLGDSERLAKEAYKKCLRSWKSDFLKVTRSKWRASCAFVVCQPRNFPAGLLSNFVGTVTGLTTGKVISKKETGVLYVEVSAVILNILQDHRAYVPPHMRVQFFACKAHVMAIWCFKGYRSRIGRILHAKAPSRLFYIES